MDAAGLRRVWPEVMSAVREVNKPTHALLQNATVAAVEGTTVTLAMPTAPLARQLSQPNRASHVTAALGRVLSGEWAVRATDATGQAAGGSGSERRPGTRPPAVAAAQHRSSAAAARGTPAPPRGQQDRPSAPPSDGGRPRATPALGRSAPVPAPERRAGRRRGGGRSADAPPARPDASSGRGPARPPAAAPDIPPPPEPPDEDDVSEEDMYAEAQDGGGGTVDRRTPDDIAMELLTEQLGARRVDGATGSSR